MKFDLRCRKENYTLIRSMIESYGYEFSLNYDLLFVENSYEGEICSTYLSFSENDLDNLKNMLGLFINNAFKSEKLIVKKDDSMIPISKSSICSISAGNNCSYIYSDQEYKVNLKLFEVENMLLNDGFIRINKSEIINSAKLKRIDSWFSNRYLIYLDNDKEFIVTNKYYKSFKRYIGL